MSAQQLTPPTDNPQTPTDETRLLSQNMEVECSLSTPTSATFHPDNQAPTPPLGDSGTENDANGLCESCGRTQKRLAVFGNLSLCRQCAPLYSFVSARRVKPVSALPHDVKPRLKGEVAQKNDVNGSTTNQNNGIKPRKKKKPTRKLLQTKSYRIEPCESCGGRCDSLESVGALRVCARCVSLFAPEQARIKSIGHNFKLHQRVQVLSLDKKWYPAKIVKVEKSRVKIHYDGWGFEFDEWVAVDSRRLKLSSDGSSSNDSNVKHHHTQSPVCQREPLKRTNKNHLTAPCDYLNLSSTSVKLVDSDPQQPANRIDYTLQRDCASQRD
jgi:hypothetical protein